MIAKSIHYFGPPRPAGLVVPLDVGGGRAQIVRLGAVEMQGLGWVVQRITVLAQSDPHTHDARSPAHARDARQPAAARYGRPGRAILDSRGKPIRRISGDPAKRLADALAESHRRIGTEAPKKLSFAEECERLGLAARKKKPR